MRWTLAAILTFLPGCWLAHERAGGVVDGGVVRDAVAGDAGVPRDAPPVVRPCERLTIVSHASALEHVDGPFEQPQVTRRADGTFDLIARRVGSSPGASDVLARRARLEPDGAISFETEERRLLGPSIWNRAATLGAILGTCSTAGGPTDLTELRRWDRDHQEIGRPMPLAALACHELVGRGDRWLLVTRGIAESTVVTERRLDGSMVRGPSFAFEPSVGANVSATEIDDGFAWVGVLDAAGRTQVVFRDDEGNDSREELRVAPRSGGAKPAIGPGFGPGSAAVAYYEASELFVTLVRRGRGEVGTSVPLAFSMSPDLDPVVVRYGSQLVAISLDYGDADPTGGALNLAVLTEGLDVTERLAVPTRRDRSLTHGGVSAAVVDDTIVVHYAEDVAERGEPPRERTSVLTLRCE